jgi:hypothetical protein
VQRTVGWLCAPITTLGVHWFLRFRLGLTLEDPADARRLYRELHENRDAPLLLCANHLTLIDSALIAWMLGSPLSYIPRFHALPWNVPESSNFASTLRQRVLSYVYKCIPIERGGDRSAVAGTLARFTEALRHGDVGLIFPPAKGDHLRARLRLVGPKTDHRGLRASLDIARQITQVLADLELEHLARHPQPPTPSPTPEGAPT